MPGTPSDRSFLAPLRNKILAGFFFAVVAIGLAASTTYFSFNDLLVKVDELSMPNDKLRVLNRLFENITRLDQEQRADFLRNPNLPAAHFAIRTNLLQAGIDSLLQMEWSHPRQRDRLEIMKRILAKRDLVWREYMRTKQSLLRAQVPGPPLDSLLAIAARAYQTPDSSIRTSEKKITTTTVFPESERKPNFFNRLFGGKKRDSEQPRVEVVEENFLSIDTLTATRQDSSLVAVGQLIDELGRSQQQRNREALKRELALVNTHIVLLNQLLSILQEVELEELQTIEAKNQEAAFLVKDSTQKIGFIILVFLLVTAFLGFLILLDFSRSHFYRKQLLASQQETERQALMKQRFLANISHELRTPVQSLVGFADLVPEPAYREEALRAIRQSANHLLYLVNDVLDFARIESDDFRLEIIPFNLDDLLEEVGLQSRLWAERKKLTFTLDITRSSVPCVLMGDPFRIRQMLLNVIGNAVKFTGEGGVHLKVTVEDDLYTTCRFEVQDTGLGMTASEVEKIFDRHQQAHAAIYSQYGGSGLGLTIVKKLADAMRGSVAIASIPRKGTTVTLTLQFERAPKAALAPRHHEPHPAATSLPIRVLVVDDDPLIVRLCSLIFEKHNLAFVAHVDPREALREDLSGIDVGLLDLRMPQLDGISLARELKTRKPALRLVAFTAHEAAGSANPPAPFDAWLPKPFREDALLDALLKVKAAGTIPAHALRASLPDDDFLQSVLAELSHETRDDLEQLREAISRKEAARVREHVHRLAGRLAQVGEEELARDFRTFEQQLEKGVTLTSIEETLQRTLSRLESWLAQLPH